MRTSYKKNRPFDFKLIDLVEPNPVLYQRQTGLSNYEAMKAKNLIWDKIAQLMGRNVEFCLMRWNNLRYQFQKELRRSEKLCPKLGVVRGSTWPYLKRLRFLLDVQPKFKKHFGNHATQKQVEQATDSFPATSSELQIWQSYDSVVMHVNAMEAPGESTYFDDSERFIIEEVIEEPNEQIIQEEVIYEDEEEQQQQNNQINLATTTEQYSTESLESPNASSVTNILRMDRLLDQLKGTQRDRAERRIMAFLLKCQLRALVNESIEDLII